MATGILTVDELLEVKHQSVLDYGLDNIAPSIQAEIDAHNALVSDAVSALCEETEERAALSGGGVGGEMIEADEFSRAPTARNMVGSKVHFPLSKGEYAVGWTREWFEVHSPADMIKETLAGEKAHLRRIQRAIRRAVYGATNYTVRDIHVDQYALDIKRFLNGDGDPIPEGPNTEVFDGATHTHYLALAANPSAAALDAALNDLIDDLVEHGHGGSVILVINRGDETAVRACPSFKAFTDPRIIKGMLEDRASGSLDMSRLDNRDIGLFGAATVRVRPWAAQGYYYVYDEADPRKPLAYRHPKQASRRGLRVAADLDTHPLYAKFLQAYFGVGVRHRTNGAVLYVGGDGSGYVSPIFN